MSATRFTRAATVAVTVAVGMLALPVTGADAVGPSRGVLEDTGWSYDECGPPGALPGIFRCESQMTPVDGDYFHNLAFLNAFRARFPYTTFDNNQIVQWGHAVCTMLVGGFAESAVVQAWLNAGYDWDGATWIVGTSENYYCPQYRAGDVVIPGA